MASTEKMTQKVILEWLGYKKIFHYRNNSGGFSPRPGDFYRIGTPGAPDIICVIKGQYIAIEVKDIKGVMNNNQVLFKENLEKAGGKYILAKSLDDVIQGVDN